MPRYFYIAKTFKGEAKSGIIEAENEHSLAKSLREKGWLLIKAEIKEDSSKKKKGFSLPFLNRVSVVDKIMFLRNLKVMISAGVSLPRTLDTLAEQTKSKKFRSIILKISEEVVRGKNFSDALEDYPSVFSEVFVNMIKVGEESGTLEDVLDVLARQMEKDYELKSKIKGAMIYPGVIVSTMFIIGILMLVIVVPKLSQTFEELNIRLPLTTRIVIGLGNFLSDFWYFLILFLFLFILCLKIASKTIPGKKIIDGFLLKIPFVSNLIKKTYSAYTVRTLSSLIDSGVPITRSLEITKGVLGNIYYKKTMEQAVKEVRKGKKLSQFLSNYKDIYPNLVVQMMEVGEESGQTAEVLSKLADFYEEEVTRITKNLSTIIEPVLMIIIGAAIGFFAISMLQPIYGMIQAF